MYYLVFAVSLVFIWQAQVIGIIGQHACLFFWLLQLDYPFLGHSPINMLNSKKNYFLCLLNYHAVSTKLNWLDLVLVLVCLNILLSQFLELLCHLFNIDFWVFWKNKYIAYTMLIMNIYQQCYSLFIHLMFLLVFISFRLHNIVVFPFDHAPLFWKVTAYQISNFRSFKYDLMINTCLCH